MYYNNYHLWQSGSISFNYLTLSLQKEGSLTFSLHYMGHKKDITEQASTVLLSYTHIQKPGCSLFWPKRKYFLTSWKHEKTELKINSWRFYSPLSCPYGPKLVVHVGNWAEALCYIYSVMWVPRKMNWVASAEAWNDLNRKNLFSRFLDRIAFKRVLFISPKI